jgi:amidohydrolase
MSLIDLKNVVQDEVDRKRVILEDVASFLYENPELGSEEYEAVEMLTDILNEHGFKIKTELRGMPTAFSATYHGLGNGPKVAVLAEYDALPDVGHGGGHNLVAASALGAAIGASRALGLISGEVTLVGTPAEGGRGSSAGSKKLLAESGFFNDYDGVFMCRPGELYSVGTPTLGVRSVNLTFKGQASHAAESPELGRNALNAATLCYMAVHMVRQEARRGANLVIHGYIPEGGIQGNIIPDRSTCRFGVRSSDDAYMDEMMERIIRCGEGVAHAMDVEVDVTKVKGYAAMKLNLPLVMALWNNYVKLGVDPVPWVESVASIPKDSTDLGDVSQRVPVVDSFISVRPPGVPAYSKQMADVTVSRKGLNAMVIGAKALGMTMVEVLAKPDLLKQAWGYFKEN